MRVEWREAAEKRETAFQRRHVKMIEKSGKVLPDLAEGVHVAVQNQHGSHPKRWDKTGMIMEALPFRQYKVKMDGSGRVTTRNRKFLREIIPACADGSILKSNPKTLENNVDVINNNNVRDVNDVNNQRTMQGYPTQLNESNCTDISRDPPPLIQTTVDSHQPLPDVPTYLSQDTIPVHTSNSQNGDLPAVDTHQPQRRSARVREPRKLFNAEIKGKTHSIKHSDSPP